MVFMKTDPKNTGRGTGRARGTSQPAASGSAAESLPGDPGAPSVAGGSSASPSELHDPSGSAASASEVATAPAEGPAGSAASSSPRRVKHSTAGATWVALIAGALLLIVLLVFILQNQQAVVLHFFGADLEFPLGVGMLLAAIIGALIMASVGVVRILQLRRQVTH